MSTAVPRLLVAVHARPYTETSALLHILLGTEISSAGLPTCFSVEYTGSSTASATCTTPAPAGRSAIRTLAVEPRAVMDTDVPLRRSVRGPSAGPLRDGRRHASESS